MKQHQQYKNGHSYSLAKLGYKNVSAALLLPPRLTPITRPHNVHIIDHQMLIGDQVLLCNSRFLTKRSLCSLCFSAYWQKVSNNLLHTKCLLGNIADKD